MQRKSGLSLWLMTTGLSVCLAFYSSTDHVVELTPDNFHKEVVQSDDLWLVEFYAPWCGHCQSLAPEWKKAAMALKGVVKVGAVNADDHRGLGGQYQVKGFPTIKVFGSDKFKPQDYQGPRTAQGIVDSAMNNLKTIISQRLSGRSGGGSGGSSGGGGSRGGGSQGGPDAVIELTDSNFEELVLKSDDLWLVEFFAPWCGHCKNLAPHWASAASELKGKAKLGAMDATVHQMIPSRYGVQGFPTIKMFPAGKKDGSAEDYDGGRTSSDIVNWVSSRVVENIPPPDVFQIINENVLTDNCEGKQLCIVSILPHILDCQSACRNNYIKILKDLGEKYKKHKWGYVWAEAMAQSDLENVLGIGGFGYPAMAALNTRKMMFSLLRGPFSEKGINEFLRDLSYGKGSTSPVKNAKLPPVKSTDPWDGKDGVLEVEEDIDLSDVELDDLEKDEL